MVEIIVTIALEVAKCLAPSAGGQISYLRQHKSNFKKLKEAIESLRQKHTSIQHRVDEATRNGEVIEDFVQKWLERATKIINDEAQKFAEDEETAVKKRCFKGLCPDLKTRHHLSKQAVEKLVELAGILNEPDHFGAISYRIPLTDPRLSNKNYVSFESRMSTLTDVINSLSNPDVNIVGIYGMPGVGKTTLAKEVPKEAERKKLFDLVVFAEVSHSPNINKIQGEIADTLGLTLSNKETDAGRAGVLSQRLKKEKKILIILDNIWGTFDLQAIGIPVGEEHKGCKVLLTARSVDVLARQMGSQENYPVDVLNDEEAWRLFLKMNGDKRLNTEGSELKSVATQVAKRCEGLPIATVTVARALINKELFEWKNALLKLRMSPSKNIEGMHATIELSYDHLKDEVLKKTILLIGYANITSIVELLMYGMGLDLFEGFNNMEDRRDQVRSLVQQLKDSCLLLDSNSTGEDFSMHDVVRDATTAIASRERHVFRNHPFNEWDWPDENTLKVYSSIVLKDVRTGQLPSVLECQQLKVFSASVAISDCAAFKIDDNLFTTMPNLKVLVLANMKLLSLPSSLSSLTNLRALGLNNCSLENIATIKHLKKLEMLSLQNSYIRMLPVEIGQLPRLKSLDLRVGWNFLVKLKVIAPNVISSLSHLEELYTGYFDEWEEERLKEDRKNASLDELKRLTKLTCLEIRIRNAKSLPNDLSFQNLERYKIEIRDRNICWDWEREKSCRKLHLSLINTDIRLNEGHIMQLKGIECLCLGGLQDMKSVVYGSDRDGFPQLKYLQVNHNSNLLCIVDSHLIGNAFPCLESLDLRFLPSLQKICGGQVTSESFNQLRTMMVESCGRLENIFSFSVARRLEQLQSIDVRFCENMKEIFAIEREDEFDSNIEFRQLRSLKLRSLLKLRSFCSASQQRRDEIVFNALFNGKVVLPSLEFLELSSVETIDIIWENQVAAVACGFQNLTRLMILNCKNLRRLSSSSVAGSFVQLQHLAIENCDGLEEIVVIDDERKDIVFPKLQFIRMERLENLTKFCSGDCIEFPSLKELKIKECPKLKEFLMRNNTTEIPSSFFNDKVALPRLETLIMAKTYRSECDEVKSLFVGGKMDHLVHLELKACENLVNLVASSTSFRNLTTLTVHEYKRLTNILTFSTAQSLVRLERMSIEECNMITEMVAADEGDEAKDYEIIFSELKELLLCYLESFTSLCSANFTLKFPFLVKLYVYDCPVMKSILTFSTVKSLDRLREMTVSRCNMITEIVAVDKEDEVKDCEIVFSELKVLTLTNLQSLTSFCSANCTLEFPSSMRLIMFNCPSYQHQEMSKVLKKIRANLLCSNSICGERNLCFYVDSSALV